MKNRKRFKVGFVISSGILAFVLANIGLYIHHEGIYRQHHDPPSLQQQRIRSVLHNSPTDLQTQPQILNTSPLSRLPSSPPPPPSSLLPSSLSSVSLSLPPPPQPPATSSNVHLVFSTDCSGYQHWQGIALWFAAKEAGQKGPITRIASGCGEQQQRDVADDTGKKMPKVVGKAQ